MPSRLVRTLVPVSVLVATSLSSPPDHAGGTAGRYHEPVAVIIGRVVDSATHQPLATTVVSVRETTLGVQTNPEGYYQLKVPVDSVEGRDIVLLVRQIGYSAVTRALHVTAGARTENFALVASQLRLEEVVITAAAGTTTSAKVLGATMAVGPARARRAKAAAEHRDKDPGTPRDTTSSPRIRSSRRRRRRVRPSPSTSTTRRTATFAASCGRDSRLHAMPCGWRS
jgi:hypothetical protein